MAKLSDEEARRIHEGIESGLRGPILLTWIRRLLEDRRERVEESKPKTRDARDDDPKKSHLPRPL